MNNFTCENLVTMGRYIPTPFYLFLGKEQQDEIKIETILRIIPGKRLIAISSWRNQTVIVKLFFGRGRWKRNFLQDIRGIHLLKDRGIPTPEILHQTTTNDQKGAVLLINYLEQGIGLQSLVEDSDSEEHMRTILQMAITLIARCHRGGLWQEDIHLNNFMLVGETIYVLDGGDIKAVDTALGLELALSNLALFFAQFTVDMDSHIPSMLKLYQSENTELPIEEVEDFALQVIDQRIKRLDLLEKKLFRSTTANRNIQDSTKFIVYDRQIHSVEIEKFIENLNDQFLVGKIIKAGNASTVSRIALGSNNYICKRYNLKSFWHSVRYLFKPSRAHHSWRNAWILEMLGVDTPHPCLIFEERLCYFLRRRAYFLCQDLNEKNLLEQFETRAETLPIEKLVQAFKTLFEIMIKYQISHGDMKASNFIFSNDRLYVLDLDAMKRHKNKNRFIKAMQRDLDRFMKNWKGSSLEGRFKEIVNQINLYA